MNNIVTKVKESISNAEKETSKLTPSVLEISGFSSPKVRHFLNNIIDYNSRYLEIGIFIGSTFISALYKNKPKKAFAIDTWLEGTTVNEAHPKHPKHLFYNNVNNFLESDDIVIIQEDCFKIDLNNREIHDINTYFYDGNHSHESQYNSLIYYYNALSDTFIFIVDDWLMGSAKSGTIDAIKDLKLITLFEQEMHADYNGDIVNWWDGLYISVLKKPE